jgi:hypothetical protein
VLVGLVLVALFTPDAMGAGAQDGQGDLATYADIRDRMRHGEGYYAAAHTELVRNHYGVRSVFNWRTPLYPHLVAWAPSVLTAQLVLAAVALAAGVVAMRTLTRLGSRAATVCGGVALALSLLTTLVPGTVFFAEITAGVLILLSVGLLALGRTTSGVVAGAAALFVRELAGVYVGVALILAVRRRDWRQVTLWLVTLALYTAYFAVHIVQVRRTLTTGDPAYDDGWVQLGGVPFVLQTAQVNGVFFVLPLVLTAVYVTFALLGLSGLGAGHRGLVAWTVTAYLTLFLVIGKPFNVYWGALYTPLLAIGAGMVPLVLADLRSAAVPRAVKATEKADER